MPRIPREESSSMLRGRKWLGPRLIGVSALLNLGAFAALYALDGPGWEEVAVRASLVALVGGGFCLLVLAVLAIEDMRAHWMREEAWNSQTLKKKMAAILSARRFSTLGWGLAMGPILAVALFVVAAILEAAISWALPAVGWALAGGWKTLAAITIVVAITAAVVIGVLCLIAGIAERIAAARRRNTKAAESRYRHDRERIDHSFELMDERIRYLETKVRVLESGRSHIRKTSEDVA